MIILYIWKYNISSSQNNTEKCCFLNVIHNLNLVSYFCIKEYSPKAVVKKDN